MANLTIPDRPVVVRQGPEQLLHWAALASIIFFVLTVAFVGGMWLRQWTWQQCRPLRWAGDRNNAFYWGMRVNQDERQSLGSPIGTWSEFWLGYRSIYDKEKVAHTQVVDYLDYTPLRLLTAALWARWAAVHEPLDQPTWSSVVPLLWLNVCCALVTSVGAFFVVGLWVKRAEQGSSIASCRAWIIGLISALLVWLNPAGILDSHGWPQWDVWCAPFLVWAVYCASIGAWYPVGVLVLLGAMMKGQILLGAPVLLIWAMLAGGFMPLLKALTGFFTAAALVTCIWLLPTGSSWLWVGTIVGAAAINLIAAYISRIPKWIRVSGSIATVSALWPLVAPDSRQWNAAWLLLLIWSLTLLPWVLFMRLPVRRWTFLWMSAVVCGALWAGCYLFDGSMSWFGIGFLFPTDHFHVMSHAASSVPAILESRFSWHLNDIVIAAAFPRLGFPDGINMQWTMRLIYAVLLLLCGIAAAVQSRRRSARVLLAVVAPWILFYAVLPQMQERYLVWAALFSALSVGWSMHMLPLHLLITAISFTDILRKMCFINPGYAPRLYRALGNVYPQEIPELGWIVLLVGLIYLYLAWACFSPRRRGGAE